MKVKKYQSNEERYILTALIVHDGVLGRVQLAGIRHGLSRLNDLSSSMISTGRSQALQKLRRMTSMMSIQLMLAQ